MILPRQMVPKRFALRRIEGAILAGRKPSMPKLFKVTMTDAERRKHGKQAGWAKRAKRLAAKFMKGDA